MLSSVVPMKLSLSWIVTLCTLFGLLGPSGCGLLGVSVAGASPEFEDLVRASVFAEHPGVAPGETVWVGVHFEVAEGWHIYWPGQNDTGMVTTITPSGPEWVSFGSPVWPAPTRYYPPGGTSLDHVLKGGVTVMVPVSVSTDAEVGRDLTLRFALEWLACEEVCIPGDATVELTLPVTGEMPAADPAAVRRIERVRGRQPAQVPEDQRVVVVEWNGWVATVRARGAYSVAFYPDERSTPVVDLLKSGLVTESDVLRLRFDKQEPELSGVVEVFARDGRSRVYSVRSSPEASGG